MAEQTAEVTLTVKIGNEVFTATRTNGLPEEMSLTVLMLAGDVGLQMMKAHPRPKAEVSDPQPKEEA